MTTNTLAKRLGTVNSNSLVGILELSFEQVTERPEPQTLAEAVSNALMPVMPRISPELFKITRDIEIPLSGKMRDNIADSIFGQMGLNFREYKRGREVRSIRSRGKNGRGEDMYYERVRYDNFNSSCCTMSSRAKVPAFAYTLFPKKTITFPKTLEIILSILSSINSRDLADFNVSMTDIWGNKYHFFDIKPYYHELERRGSEKIEQIEEDIFSAPLNISLRLPRKLHVSVEVPKIPDSLVELGDEAVAGYYNILTRMPLNERKRTTLETPRVGIVWAPSDYSFYCSTKIPQRLPLPERDPALVLDIPNGGKSHRHVIAVWDTEHELPLKNWLAEYTSRK